LKSPLQAFLCFQRILKELQKRKPIKSAQYLDKHRTDQLDFVVRARIRTVAQFESANFRRFPATVRPEADN
jgi:3-methyladenine DNA glycosylase AlkC